MEQGMQQPNLTTERATTLYESHASLFNPVA